MTSEYLTIKELTEAAGSRVTPRMVRHYHTLGLLPAPQRSQANYRLYTAQDVQRLQRIVALKQQGFQLSHIQRLLENDSDTLNPPLIEHRLAHLGCSVSALINNPHITSADEAERLFWGDRFWQAQLAQVPEGCVLAIGYAPSVLLTACQWIEQGKIQPALVIGMPIGFSHAPAAKRRLMHSQVDYVTIEGTLGGGLLAAVTFNALAASLIAKPDCHCHLSPA